MYSASIRLFFLFSVCLHLGSAKASAKDYFLTLGGGYSRDGNQASLEKNVLYFQKLLAETKFPTSVQSILFANGNTDEATVQTIAPELLPRPNQLMAEFFGSDENLGLSYHPHTIERVDGSLTVESLEKWFESMTSVIGADDRLIIYVTAHGTESEDDRTPYNTTIALWNDEEITVEQFCRLLDKLPTATEVVTIMVQCYSGGFSHLIFDKGHPHSGLSSQRRCGFFATVHDRQAAGCTAEIDESTYVEYSTYFLNALAGHDRSGNPIDPPDYNKDGKTTFEEAHAYTILTADTIDLPVKTSGEYLSVYSRFRNNGRPDLLSDEEPYDTLLKYATPSERAVLEGLSEQLKLTGQDRIVQAWRATDSQPNERRGRRPRSRGPEQQLRQLQHRIARDLEEKWPELANVLNPLSVELLTTRQDEFVEAIENHSDFNRYQTLKKTVENAPDAEKKNVKYERFLRVADNIILAENLKRIGDRERIAEFEEIVKLESGTLR
ncbi:hypothetical protein AB1L42_11570 [Thalassoglobus sp. JC818]|uniref:hypothetical protein n=1 Tax=Thalassoglobus sp. JC818 TaxID=3232136 RepID=UPI00345AE64D